LQEQINKTTIKAPFDGVVTAKLTEEGAFAAPGVPLLQITDIRTL
jgi:membrane fusion protein (multidrug efflux system)